MSDAQTQGGSAGAGEGFSAVAAAQSLHEDLKVAYWILVTSARNEEVRAIEAQALIRSLLVTMHAEAETSIPLFDVANPQLYTTAHAVNVACVTMALAEELGFAEREVRTLGLAGLMKDIGEATLPVELLGKREPLTAPELERMRRHPADGARMLIETEEPLELPAVVAYEHHLGPEGRGYPPLEHPRPTHFASRLIRLVDVFCALHTSRPHREAWDFEEVLSHIAERAGVEFDRELTGSLADTLRRLRPRILRLTSPDQKLPWAG